MTSSEKNKKRQPICKYLTICDLLKKLPNHWQLSLASRQCNCNVIVCCSVAHVLASALHNQFYLFGSRLKVSFPYKKSADRTRRWIVRDIIQVWLTFSSRSVQLIAWRCHVSADPHLYQYLRHHVLHHPATNVKPRRIASEDKRRLRKRYCCQFELRIKNLYVLDLFGVLEASSLFWWNNSNSRTSQQPRHLESKEYFSNWLRKLVWFFFNFTLDRVIADGWPLNSN